MAPSGRVYRAICASCGSEAAACRLVLPIAAQSRPARDLVRPSALPGLQTPLPDTGAEGGPVADLVARALPARQVDGGPDSGDERTIPFVVLCVGDCPSYALDELLRGVL